MLQVSAAAICLSRLDGGELRPTLGVDLASVGFAPRDELCHAQIDPDGGLTLPAQAAFALFYGGNKFGIRVVKGVRIFHDGLGCGPFLCREEGQTNAL